MTCLGRAFNSSRKGASKHRLDESRKKAAASDQRERRETVSFRHEEDEVENPDAMACSP